MKKIEFYKILFLNLIFLSILAGIIFIIDPYQRYRKPFYKKTVEINQTALNPGLLKNYSYDSLILGSSMAQNFISEETNINLRGNFINVSIGGAQAGDLKYIFDTAKRNKDIKKVLISLDVWALEGNSDITERYEHLYTDNHIKDYKYLLSAQSWLDSLKILIKTKRNPYDLTFNGYKGIYRLENALNSYREAKENNIKKEKNKNILKIQQNLENTWLRMLKENQDTEFTFYFPPYSILTYKIWDKEYDEYMDIKKILIERILTYTNAKIYDFQNVSEVTHNLNNYKDFSHYHPRINSWILEQIKENKNRVLSNNYIEKIDELNKQVMEYKVN